MIPKFRAWDSGSLCRMYQPDEVMVGDGNIWIIDEDDVAGEWIVNNDLNLMQSTGLFDNNGKEIFDGDILTDGHTTGDIRNHPTLGFYTVDESSKEGYLSDTVGIEDFEEAKEFMRNSIEVIGNIYENPELLEVKE